MTDFFLAAKITAPGKDGFVKISSYSDFPERFLKLKKVYIDFFDDKKVLFVEKVIKNKNTYLLKFRNFNTKEDIDILLGKEIFVDNENLLKLPPDHFFVHDLLGSSVFKDDIKIGIIKDVLTYPANDVYVIEQKNGEELLIPAVKHFIKNFNPVEKKLILMPGIDLYEDDED